MMDEYLNLIQMNLNSLNYLARKSNHSFDDKHK